MAGRNACRATGAIVPGDNEKRFWAEDADALLSRLRAGPGGLSSAEAEARLEQYGPNRLKPRERRGTLSLFIGQFRNPIVLVLLAAAVLSLFLGDRADAGIILVIVVFSGLLGFWQERGAANAVQGLLARVQVTTAILRDGETIELPVDRVVPGDVVALGAGDVVPADCRILDSRDLYVDESALTGETFPVEKEPGSLPPGARFARRTNAVFMGTHVVSGSGRALAAVTGRGTEFGKVSQRLVEKPLLTEFEHGIRDFGYFLGAVTLLLVVGIFIINVILKRPVLDSFLFSLALAVGLTPQLLPAIISINLAKGARRMAGRKVIVKRMVAIENLGSMNVFCSDKTGTLTEGKVELRGATDARGHESEATLLYAYLNASFETGFTNPIDEAIRRRKGIDISDYSKIDEVPYDFERKKLSILVEDGRPGGDLLMITKGALLPVLEACASAREPDGRVVPIDGVEGEVRKEYEKLSGEGFRVLGVACRELPASSRITAADEKEMVFQGMLSLADPPKPGIAATVALLEKLGVTLKVITGDNRLVAAHVSREIGLGEAVMTGEEVDRASDGELASRVTAIDIFAEVEPNQKERIIKALSAAGNVVGYMGDGVNDVTGLRAADVGISVDGAVDVAKEAADFVLLEHDLGVLADGVLEGRTTFANTMKYVFMATSANFGNMFSMAGASLFLRYLPLLPGQVLLTNLLTDFPEMTIATDSVDPELVDRPRRWDISYIRRFMLVFGLLSSVFDYATFGALLLLLNAGMVEFRTGWFIESVISASMIVLVIRTRKLFLKSRPGRYLLATTLVVAAVTVALPYTPLGRLVGFAGLPGSFYPLLLAILASYVLSAELGKRLFFRWVAR